MFNRKPFLIGLGTGMVLASLLLRLTMATDARSSRTADEVERWKAEAARNGYRLLTEEEVAKLQAEAAERARSETVNAADGSAAGSPAPTPAASVAAEVSPVPAEVSVLIPAGAVAMDVARLLADAGVVADVYAFHDELVRRQKAKKIVSGTYTLSKGMPVDQLIGQITLP